MSEHSGTTNSYKLNFKGEMYPPYTGGKSFTIEIHECPDCEKWTIEAYSANLFEGSRMINPVSMCIQFPEYIPRALRSDYEEAQAIKNLSPKAAATLARRCLQGMIRDFWKIQEKDLFTEISALQSKVPPSQWAAIDGLRRIGNIGAHMEKDVELIIDVDPDEADKLIKLVEMLLEKWYIGRHDEEQLLSDITAIADQKKLARSR